MRSNYTYIIGIDCGVKTGLCIWNSHKKEVGFIATYQIHEAMKVVESWCNSWPGLVLVRVEDARKRKWIPFQKNEKAERGRREGAGSVKRDALIWEGFLKSLGVAHELVEPKRNKTKVDAKYFETLTGYKGKTSEHARDAAMLVVGY